MKETFRQKYGDGETSYIKMSQINQNEDGTKYCVSYYDDGNFYLSIFDDFKAEPSVSFNKLLKLSTGTTAIDDLYEPYSASCFMSN